MWLGARGIFKNDLTDVLYYLDADYKIKLMGIDFLYSKRLTLFYGLLFVILFSLNIEKNFFQK